MCNQYLRKVTLWKRQLIKRSVKSHKTSARCYLGITSWNHTLTFNKLIAHFQTKHTHTHTKWRTLKRARRTKPSISKPTKRRGKKKTRLENQRGKEKGGEDLNNENELTSSALNTAVSVPDCCRRNWFRVLVDLRRRSLS